MVSARVVVVGLDLDPEEIARCTRLLDDTETTRAERFLRAEDRERFIASHAALRIVLGRELGLSPDSLEFGHEAAGRPFLRTPNETGLDFNLSHSGRLAVIGLTRHGRIGVDVERVRPLPDALRIARAHFAPEEIAALERLPPTAREQAFFGLWARKEAVVKALGAGLSQPLSGFAVTMPPEAPRMLRMEGDASLWTFATVASGPEEHAVAAVTAGDVAIYCETLAEGWLGNFDAK